MPDRFKLIAAVHVFLLKGNQVFMARRFNTGYADGMYSVPAGHVEENETIKQAAVREAKEEVGVTIREEDLTFGNVMHRIGDKESIDFFFICRTWQNEPCNVEPDKCDEVRWVSVDSLPENTVPYLRFALEETLKNHPYSEFGWK